MKQTFRSFCALLLCFALGTSTLYGGEPVKNIIFLIGDGMGLSSVSMMQLVNEYRPTIFDEADNIALQKSYSADNRVTDSAASGTALATGHKTNNTYIGVLPNGSAVESLTELAKRHGKATGIVVTTVVQHATPAAFYAHVANRHEYIAITEQLVASTLDVVVGGGMSLFNERYSGDVERVIADAGYHLVRTTEELEAASCDSRIMALVADKEVGADSGDYLARATRKAIDVLAMRGGDEGFVLMVEGSLIDGMAHGNDALAQQREMEGFMGAIEVAVEYARNHPDTLVVVTADHETGGLELVSANSDFNLSEQGVEFRWATDGHSAQMVPIYLYGCGAELINGIMENAELGTKLKAIVAK